MSVCCVPAVCVYRDVGGIRECPVLLFCITLVMVIHTSSRWTLSIFSLILRRAKQTSKHTSFLSSFFLSILETGSRDRVFFFFNV